MAKIKCSQGFALAAFYFRHFLCINGKTMREPGSPIAIERMFYYNEGTQGGLYG
jgi:hypothetical protein